jgi:hypothetical protein
MGDGPGGHLGPAVGTKLGHHMMKVNLDGLRDAERPADLPISPARCDERGHLLLAEERVSG